MNIPSKMSAQNTSETSTSKHNWFLRYTFNPDLYRFHGLAIDDLPYVCKRYIDQHPAILAQPETCTRQCAELILTLWDDLEDRDTAILAIRREFRAVILQVREVDKLHGKHALRFFKPVSARSTTFGITSCSCSYRGGRS